MNPYEVKDFTKEIDDKPKRFPLSATAGITLIHMGGETAQRAFNELMRPYEARLKMGSDLTEAESKALNLSFIVDTIVKGWDDITDKDGNDVPYSREAAMAMFSALPRFLALVMNMAKEEDAFEKARVEEEVGNSLNTSNGAVAPPPKTEAG